MKKYVRIISLVFAFALIFLFAGCEGNDAEITSSPIDVVDTVETEAAEPSTEYIPSMDFFTVPDSSTESNGVTDENKERTAVKFTMKDGGSFVIELYDEYAPETCANFVKLVNEGFYDGLTFHRVIDGFMAQGGDPEGTDLGGAKNKIKGEFYANGFTQNTISHKRGIVSMARSNDFNSASSQFFICYDDCSYRLDGGYAAFGLVTEGMEVVDSFLKVERTFGSDDALSKPKTPIVIEKAEVIK